MTDPTRVSTTSVTADSPLVFYSNSPEVTDVGPNYIRIIPGNTVGPLYLSSGDVSYNEVDGTIIVAEDVAAAAEAANDNKPTEAFKFPSLSDIQVISKEVVYDASGAPSVNLVFKIKNSSGITLKGINAKVELL